MVFNMELGVQYLEDRIMSQGYVERYGLNFFCDENNFRSIYRSGLLDFMDSAVIYIDKNFFITYWNLAAEKLYGWAAEEVEGKNMDILFCNQFDAEKKKKFMNKMLKNGRFDFKITHKTRDGNVIIINSRIIPIKCMETIRGYLVINNPLGLDDFRADIKKNYNIVKTIFENTTDSIYLKDLNGHYIMINKAGSAVFGKKPEEVIGLGDRQLFPDTEAEAIIKCDKELMEGGETRTFEETVHSIGTPKTYLSTKGPYRDSKGNIKGLFGISRDITPIKEAEENMAYKALMLSQVNDAVVMVDNEKCITYWNKGAELIYGLKSGEVMGKPREDIYKWSTSESERSAYQKLEKNGYWHGENAHVRWDGKKIHAETTLSTIKNENNEKIGILAVIRDVTERKYLEKKLTESEERYRIMVEKAKSGVLLIGSRGHIKYINKKMAEMLGFKAQEVFNRNIFELIDDKTLRTFRNHFKLDKGNPFEVKFTRKDGSYLWALVSTKTLFKDNNEYMGSILILNDITARRDVEKSLMNAMLEKDRNFKLIVGNMAEALKLLMKQEYSEDYDREYT
ncbi:PAS domain protein [anaerobic digester metagenome]